MGTSTPKHTIASTSHAAVLCCAVLASEHPMLLLHRSQYFVCFMLQSQATARGDKVVTLLGNHEFMLLTGDYR